jgi:hypothetical protein
MQRVPILWITACILPVSFLATVHIIRKAHTSTSSPSSSEIIPFIKATDAKRHALHMEELETLQKFTRRAAEEQARYVERVHTLCEAGVVHCTLPLPIMETEVRPVALVNPPCCKNEVDPFGWRISGSGTGALQPLDNGSVILAGHMMLNRGGAQPNDHRGREFVNASYKLGLKAQQTSF